MKDSGSRAVVAALAGCYALHVVVRLLISSGVELDDAQQLIWVQEFRLGYGEQPPLYTWLLMPVLRVFGPGVFGLALFKYGLLFATFALLLAAARTVLRDHPAAVPAALLLVATPEVGYGAHRTLTHTVLLVAASAATLAAGVRLFFRPADDLPRALHYALFGAALGAGFLAKYNFLLFAVPFLLAALGVPSCRKTLLRRGALFACAAFLLVTAPHLIWLARHGDAHLPAGDGLDRFFLHADAGPFAARLKACGLLLRSVAALGGPMLIAVGILEWRQRRRGAPATSPSDPDVSRLFRRTLAIGLGLALLAALAGAVRFRERWLLPALLVLPLFLALRGGARWDARTCRALTRICALVFVSMLVAIPAGIVLADRAGYPHRLNARYAELCTSIREAVPAPGHIVAGSALVGGHLRLVFKDIPVRVADGGPGAARGRRLVVWDAAAGASTRRRLAPLVPAGSKPHEVSADYRFSTRFTTRLRYVFVPDRRDGGDGKGSER